MAFHTIWSVDLGKSSLKAVKLRREKNSVEILAVDKVDYPLSENGVDSTAQQKEALNIFKTRNQVKDPVVVAHPGQGTFSRFIKVPAFDPKKVRDMVRYEASQQIPFPLDEVIWDYHIVDRDYLAGEEREVGLFAVRKEAIDDYLLEFTQEGLSVEMLSIGYLGLLNFIRFDINPPEPSVVLDIGAAHTDLVLVDGARFWIRPLPHSGNDISKAIMARFKLAFPDAEKLKIETGKAPQQAEKIFKAVIQPKLQELVQEVQRSLGYYRSQHGETKFTKVYLLGNGSKIVGIKKFLEETLGMEVEKVASIGRMRVSRDVNVKLLQSDLPAFGTALGLGIQAVGAGNCQVDLVPKEEKVKKEINRKRKHVFFAAGVLLLAILGAWGLVKGRIAKVEKLIEEVDQRTEVKVASSKPLQTSIEKLEKQSTTQLGKVIEDLEQLAEVRQGALAGLRALERVEAQFARKEPVEGQSTAGDEDGKKKLVDEALTRMKDRAWIPYLRIELVRYPEDASRPGGGGAKNAGPKKDEKPTAPAYKFTAYAVVKEGENQQVSSEVIKALVTTPLKNELNNPARNWTKLLEIEVKPGVTGLKSIFHSPASTGGGQAVSAKDDVPETQGGPFFGQELQWYMLPRFAPQPVVVEKVVEEEPETGPKGKGKGKGGKNTEKK